MDLAAIWFLLIAILYMGYFVLEGFDFGVGILLPFLGKSDQQRRIIINTIGPHWDGNEVWLVTAGGATFAAFPDWYATMFSGFYLPFSFILLALILRGVAFEFRSKDDNLMWRSFWDWAIFGGSLIPAFLWGVAFANLIRGVPIDQNLQYIGGFWNLLNPYAMIGGLMTCFGFVVHGAVFLSLKTTNELRNTARSIARNLWIPNFLLLILFTVMTYFETDILSKQGVNPGIIPILAILSLLVAGWYIREQKDGKAFAFTTTVIGSTVASLFLLLFPRLMISSIDIQNSLTIYNSASGPVTLSTMSWIALIFLPLVLAYQGWSYWIFRNRITSKSRLEY